MNGVASSIVTHAGRFGHGGAYGYQSDSNNLQLLGHRFYDPNAGRFLTRDRIKDGRNWYAYCENNPLTYADPDGLARIENQSSSVVYVLVSVVVDGKKYTVVVRLEPGMRTAGDVDGDFVWDPVRKEYLKTPGSSGTFIVRDGAGGKLDVQANPIGDAAVVGQRIKAGLGRGGSPTWSPTTGMPAPLPVPLAPDFKLPGTERIPGYVGPATKPTAGPMRSPRDPGAPTKW